MENTAFGYFLASVIFLVTFVATFVFFIRSFKDGYWGKHGEDVKYQVFEDQASRSAQRPSALCALNKAKGARHA